MVFPTVTRALAISRSLTHLSSVSLALRSPARPWGSCLSCPQLLTLSAQVLSDSRMQLRDTDCWMEAGLGEPLSASFPQRSVISGSRGVAVLLRPGLGSCTCWLRCQLDSPTSSGKGQALLYSLLAAASCPPGSRAPAASEQTCKSPSTGGGLCFPRALSLSKANKPVLSVTDPEHLIVLWKGNTVPEPTLGS